MLLRRFRHQKKCDAEKSEEGEVLEGVSSKEAENEMRRYKRGSAKKRPGRKGR
jgi:hypothetical protein